MTNVDIRAINVETEQALSLQKISDFTQGLNLAGDPFELADNESPEMCNVDPGVNGGFCTRNGVEIFGQTTPLDQPICEIFQFHPAGGSAYLFASLEDGTVVFSTDAGDWQPFPDLPAATNAPDCCWKAIQFDDVLIFYNGTDTGFVWDGTTLTPLGTGFNEDTEAPTNNNMPLTKCVTYHAGHLWVVDEDNCRRLRYSHPIDGAFGPLDYREGDFLEFAPEECGGCITAIIACGPRLYVFTEHATYQIIGSQGQSVNQEGFFNNFAVTQKTGATGCKAVICCDGIVFAFDEDSGLMAFSEGQTRYLFAKLAPLMCKIGGPKRRERIAVFVCRRRVWVSFPRAGGGCETYVLDLNFGDSQTWTKYDLETQCFLDWCPEDTDRKCLAVLKDCNAVVEIDVKDACFDDKGKGDEPIEAVYRSNWYGSCRSGVNNPFSEKTWCDTDVLVKNFEKGGAISVAQYGDWSDMLLSAEGDNSPSIDASGDDGTKKKTRLKAPKCPESCSMQLEFSGQAPFCVCAYLLKYKEQPITKEPW